MILLMAWWIWKHRNAAVFDNTRPSGTSLLDMIKAEARAWAEAGGAHGARKMLPRLWVELYGGVFVFCRPYTKTLFSINASKRNAYCVFTKKTFSMNP
jgi:hypothetical protein